MFSERENTVTEGTFYYVFGILKKCLNYRKWLIYRLNYLNIYILIMEYKLIIKWVKSTSEATNLR